MKLTALSFLEIWDASFFEVNFCMPLTPLARPFPISWTLTSIYLRLDLNQLVKFVTDLFLKRKKKIFQVPNLSLVG